MPTKEKGREAKCVSALGKRRTSLDHTPKNADWAKCPGSLVIFVIWWPSYLQVTLWMSFLNYCLQSLSVNVTLV